MTSRNPVTGEKGKKGFDVSLWAELLQHDYNERERSRLDTLARTTNHLAEYFKDKNIRTLFLVGSILQPGRFYPFSDIDILVDGLEEDYLKTLTEVENLLQRPVDLIEGERCLYSEGLKKRGVRIL